MNEKTVFGEGMIVRIKSFGAPDASESKNRVRGTYGRIISVCNTSCASAKVLYKVKIIAGYDNEKDFFLPEDLEIPSCLLSITNEKRGVISFSEQYMALKDKNVSTVAGAIAKSGDTVVFAPVRFTQINLSTCLEEMTIISVFYDTVAKEYLYFVQDENGVEHLVSNSPAEGVRLLSLKDFCRTASEYRANSSWEWGQKVIVKDPCSGEKGKVMSVAFCYDEEVTLNYGDDTEEITECIDHIFDLRGQAPKFNVGDLVRYVGPDPAKAAALAAGARVTGVYEDYGERDYCGYLIECRSINDNAVFYIVENKLRPCIKVKVCKIQK